MSFEIDVECITCAIHALLFSLGNFPRKYFVCLSPNHITWMCLMFWNQLVSLDIAISYVWASSLCEAEIPVTNMHDFPNFMLLYFIPFLLLQFFTRSKSSCIKTTLSWTDDLYLSAIFKKIFLSVPTSLMKRVSALQSSWIRNQGPQMPFELGY